MMTKKEYQFFYENAPSGIFVGEGISLSGEIDFDFDQNIYDKWEKEISSLVEKNYIELGEGTDLHEFLNASKYEPGEEGYTLTLTVEGLRALQEAEKKYNAPPERKGLKPIKEVISDYESE